MALSHLTELVGLVLAGRYRLLAPIGAGASAQVYLADDVQLQRRVAVKVLHPGLAEDPVFLRRFQAEARSAAALNHPNVVAVYDWGHDGVPFLVTEYLDGGSMRAVLDKGGVLTPSQTLVVGLEAARGLHYAHKRGFVHRDVKPGNMLFGEDARLRIADFGLARALAAASWTEPEGVVLGTAKYVSPEQATGAELDGRSDVYSLALALAECMTGVVPHVRETAIATLRARVGRSIEADPAYGPLTQLIVDAGTAAPEDRLTAAQFGRALMSVAAELPAPDALELAPPVPVDRVFDTDGSGRNGAGSVLDGGGSVGPGTGRTRTASTGVVRISTGNAARGSGSAAERRLIKLASHDSLDSTSPRHGVRLPQRARRGDPFGERPQRTYGRWVALLLLLAGVGVTVALVAPQQRGVLARGPEPVTVEDYTGRPYGELEQIAEEAGWTLQTVTTLQDNTTVGEVLHQSRPAGNPLTAGGTLTVTVSAGELPVSVPTNLVGQDEATVVAALEAADLAPERSYEYDEVAPAGKVLEVTRAGSEVPKQTRIDVIVSSGPEPRSVPTLVGLTGEAAKAALEAESLVYSATEAYSNSVPAGIVISVEPAAGTDVVRDTSVIVQVSLGRQPLTIPDLTGRAPAEAADTLEGMGFVVDQEGPANREVLTTDPPPGEVRYVGDRVTVISRRN